MRDSRGRFTAAQEAHSRRFEERLSEVEMLLGTGAAPTEVARRLGTSVSALSRQLYRRGHDDIGAIFAREEGRQRRGSAAYISERRTR